MKILCHASLLISILAVPLLAPAPDQAEEPSDELKESNVFRIADDEIRLAWSKVEAEQREAIRHHPITKHGLSSTEKPSRLATEKKQ